MVGEEGIKKAKKRGDAFCVSDVVWILKIVIIVDCSTTSTEKKKKKNIRLLDL